MRRHCLTLDLKDDADLVRQYVGHHRPGHVWPEVISYLRASGVRDMQIYLSGTRLVMILEADGDFSLSTVARVAPARVREWEDLMSRFQASLPSARKGERWVQMEMIFDLAQHKT